MAYGTALLLSGLQVPIPSHCSDVKINLTAIILPSSSRSP